jgi:tetratricopeptide (TPR) repeat protein
LSDVYAIQGKYELAIASYQKAIELDSKDADFHYNLGSIYHAQGDYKLAILSYQKAIELDPKNAYPHNGLGYVYQAQGEYELAISSYQKAIELDSKFSHHPHNGLGYVYQVQGMYELAISSYQKAIKLDPKFAYPKLNFGSVMGLQDKQEESINLRKQGLELMTGNSQHDRLFRALHEVGIGEIERGINSLREILETKKPPVGILIEVLKDAEIMARFPTKLEGIDTVIEILQQAIQNAQ